jgi:hypothetical protein
MRENDRRKDAKYFLLLGAAVFLLVGFGVEHQGNGWMEDFKSLYFSTRCLIEHLDPYRPTKVLEVYLREGPIDPTDGVPTGQLQGITLNVYPPAAFILAAPFALLAWNLAHILWMILIAACFVLSGYLVWDLAADSEPLLSGMLVGLQLADGFGVLLTGNAAGITVSLCVISVWCFMRNRFVLPGIFCLGLSLAVKPHDAWLIWLCLLLGGAVYRRRALQSLLCAALFSLPAFLWVAHVAPNWMHELQSNLSIVSGPGGRDNPGPLSLSSHTAGMIVDLQTIFSVFKDEPHFYNSVSYLCFGILLAVWLFATVLRPASRSRIVVALATLAAFTMLPTYHRVYDTRILFLTIPAFAELWTAWRAKRWLALAVTAAGIFFTGDLVLAIFVLATDKIRFSAESTQDKVWTILLTRPVPVVLLVVGCFYLMVYVRRSGLQRKIGDEHAE